MRQRNKTRPIDDFRENTLNQSFGSVERPELRTMDHVLWSLVVLAQYISFHEHMRFVLEDGTVLEGDVHADWKKLKPVFKTTCVDLQSAYKQLAVHPEEHKRSVVTLGPQARRTGLLCLKCFALWGFCQCAPLLEDQFISAGGGPTPGAVLGCIL